MRVAADRSPPAVVVSPVESFAAFQSAVTFEAFAQLFAFYTSCVRAPAAPVLAFAASLNAKLQNKS